MKRMMCLLLAAILSLACLTGCGSGNSGDSGSTNGGSKIQSLDDLEGKMIGVQLGTTGDLAVTDTYGEGKVERYNKGFEAVQALLQGKIDAVVIDDQPAGVFVAENEGLTILETEFISEDYAMCVSKDNPELLEKMNAAIAEIKADGTLDAIIDYYLTESEGAARYQSPEGIDRSNGTLTMATNAEFPPFEMHEGNEIVGIDADFARAIADKLGMELQIEDMNFDSIIMAVQSGKCDFAAGALTVTEARQKEVDFTDTYFTGRQVVIVKE